MSLIGRSIGNYLIKAKIGEGGMGAVYLGEHPLIGKRVAVKVLLDDLVSKEEIITRFFIEARSVNDIGHANIVDIIDYGKTTGPGNSEVVYFIMEYLEGESIAARLRRTGFDFREASHIITQCCSALSASHKKAIVHRDLKPENIFLCHRGGDPNFVKILDFGIAKLIGDQANSAKTRTGLVIGTPAYMSPEQCEGRGNMDARSDIYSLGIVLYELLTGRVPFSGDGFGEVLVAHLTRTPERPSALNPKIPPALEAIVLHALEKDREKRFHSMDDFAAAIAAPDIHLQNYRTLPSPVSVPPAAVAHLDTMMAASPLPATQLPATQLPATQLPATQLPATQLPATQLPVTQLPVSALPATDLAVVALPGAPPSMSSLIAPTHLETLVKEKKDTVEASVHELPTEMKSGSMRGPTSVAPPHRTTLSGVATELSTQMPAEAPKARSMSLWAGAAVVVVAVVALILVRGGSTPAVQQPISIALETTPSGAEVSRTDGRPIGKTPYAFSIEPSAARQTFDVRLHLAGYKDVITTVDPERTKKVQIELTKEPIAPPVAAPIAAPTPTPTSPIPPVAAKETTSGATTPAVSNSSSGKSSKSHGGGFKKVSDKPKVGQDGDDQRLLQPNFN